MGAFATIGARLIERGYAPVPIIPGSKRPGLLSNGQWVGLPRWQTRYHQRQPSETEIAHWAEGDAGVGVVGGFGGMVAIDIDTEDAAIRAALDTVLPRTPVRKIGKRGETLFYYAPEITESKRWTIDGEVIAELIGPGRQTVLPPTIHPDTATATDDSPHRRLNDAAMANLSAWVPALPLHRLRAARGGYEAAPTWRPSSSGKSDDERALNLKIHPKGIRDFGARDE
jgi:hypothetical protein